MTISTVLSKTIRKISGNAYPYPQLAFRLNNLSRKKGYNGVHFKHEKIDVVLLTLNRKADTQRTLQSLYKTTVEFNLIIIDQNSDDGTREFLQEFVKDKNNTELILLEENIGVSGGRSKAISYCKTNYVTFIDNDMFFAEGYFENLLATMQTNNVAAVVGKVVLPNKLIELNCPLFKIEDNWIEFYDQDKSKKFNDPSTFEQRFCNWIPGVAMWRRKVLLEIPIDKDLIGGYEDNEYSFRVSKAGYKFINCPSALVMHIRAEFTKALNDKKYVTGRHNITKLQFAAQRFYKKHNLFLAAGPKEDFVKNIGFKSINEYLDFVKA